MQVEGALDKAKIKGSFAHAAHSYDAVAALQRRVGQGLFTQIAAQNLTGTVLDVGCGTGFLSGQLATLATIEQIIALDIALPMLQTTRQKLSGQKLNLLCADAEFLPLASQSVNHIVSNLALQWCENLIAVFSNFKRVLKPDGQLLFTTFGEQTLQELKAAWAKVDGFSHVNDFYNAAEMRYFLQAAGFEDIQISETNDVSEYESVLALMRELKAIGAHNVTQRRRKTMTGKIKMQAMMREYEVLRINGLIPATFQIITVTARV